MLPHRTTVLRSVRTRRGLLIDHRGIAVSAAALAVGLAVVGCNRATPTQATPATRGSTLVSTAPDAASLREGMPSEDTGPWQREQAGVAAVSLAGPFRGSHTERRVRRITFLSGTTAVLDVDNTLTGFASLPPGTVATEPGVQRGRHKRVLVKRSGQWRILLMQITTVAPTPSAG